MWEKGQGAGLPGFPCGARGPRWRREPDNSGALNPSLDFSGPDGDLGFSSLGSTAVVMVIVAGEGEGRRRGGSGCLFSHGGELQVFGQYQDQTDLFHVSLYGWRDVQPQTAFIFVSVSALDSFSQ